MKNLIKIALITMALVSTAAVAADQVICPSSSEINAFGLGNLSLPVTSSEGNTFNFSGEIKERVLRMDKATLEGGKLHCHYQQDTWFNMFLGSHPLTPEHKKGLQILSTNVPKKQSIQCLFGF